MSKRLLRRFYIPVLLGIIALFAFSAMANADDREWIALDAQFAPASAQLILIDGDWTRTEFDLSLSGFFLDRENLLGHNFDRLDALSGMTTVDVGLPMLPVINKLIAVPEGAEVSVEISGADVEVFEGINIAPFQRPLLETELPTSAQIDQDFYGGGAVYPDSPAILSGPMDWRGLSLVHLSVSPFAYDAGANRLSVYTKLHITVIHDGSRKALSRSVSPQLAKMYQRAIVNYDLLPILTGSKAATDDVVDYLIVTTPEFVDNENLAALAQTHRDIGRNVLVVTTDDTGSTAEEIKAYLSTVYQQSDPAELDYVLFVADVTAIPFYVWNGNESDSWYAMMGDETDHIADFGLGRISATLEEDLDRVIEKTLAWHSGSIAGPWQNKSILVAHKQEYPGKYTECKETVRTKEYQFQAPVFQTIYGGEGKGNDDVIAAVEAGVGLINYRGHGDVDCWIGWASDDSPFTNAMALALENANMYPVVFGIACLNMSLEQESLAHAEAWMFSQNGAVAYLGATEPSYTMPNHDFDRALYSAIYDRGITAIGDVQTSANVEMLEIWGPDSWGSTNVEMYLWLGDPAVEMPVKGLLTPGNLNATADSETQITLTWTDRTDSEDGFRIEREMGTDGFTELATVGADVTTYTDSDSLSESMHVNYRLFAYNAEEGDSFPSEVVYTATLPLAPGSLIAQGTDGPAVYLSWVDHSSGEDGFIIERQTGASAYTELGRTSGNATTYLDDTLAEGTGYNYRVKAYTSGGSSAYTEVAQAVSPLAPPGGLVAAATGSDSIRLTWTDQSDNETGYAIQRKLLDGQFENLSTVDTDVHSYTDPGLDEGTLYFYRICATGETDSAYSNDAYAMTWPVEPGTLVAQPVSAGAVVLSWQDNSLSESGYVILRQSPDNSGFAEVAVSSPDATTFTDSGLAESTLYAYKVMAVGQGGNSPVSNQAGALTLPATPANLSGIALSDSEIELTWTDTSGGEDGLVLERLGESDWEEVARLAPNTVKATDNGLVADANYIYRVYAFNASGPSDFSDEVEVSTDKQDPQPADDDDEPDDDNSADDDDQADDGGLGDDDSAGCCG